MKMEDLIYQNNIEYLKQNGYFIERNIINVYININNNTYCYYNMAC